jgi:hypothetical protein
MSRQERQEKRAEALRENLRRRKQQKQERTAPRVTEIKKMDKDNGG